MNLAFPAMALLVLALPGIIFARAFYLGTKHSPTSSPPIGEQIVLAIPAAGLMHTVMCSIAWSMSETWGTPRVDFELVLQLLASPRADGDGTLARAAAYPAATALYLIAIYGSSVLGGLLLHIAIRRAKLDLRYSVLRFHTPWFYLFSGERLDFKDKGAMTPARPPLITGRPDFTRVQVVSGQGGDAYLYDGILSNYELDRDGNLSRIDLIEARRRKFEDDAEAPEFRTTDEVWYPIVGDYLIIDSEEITDLNVVYVWLENVDDEDEVDADDDGEPDADRSPARSSG